MDIPLKRRPKIAAVSLGCDKNRIDTETILHYLLKNGCLIVEDYKDADFVIINTCSFIDDARQESINKVLELSQSVNPRKTKLVMAGCMVEIYGDKLISDLSELSGAIGVHSYKHLNRFLKTVLQGKRVTIKRKPPLEYFSLSERLLTVSKHSVPVKIAEGCDNHCHYCLIPCIRGNYRSRPPEAIIDEVSSLLKQGAVEISLIAQDTTAYGQDKEDYPDLAGLIEMIMKFNHSFWLRIMYAYPSRVKDNLVELIRSDDRICNYLDIPLQHVNDLVLEKMGRDYEKDSIARLIDKLKKVNPEIALRTTFMIGHPGENKKSFSELTKFISDNRFDHLGSFVYSPQKGTAAFSMPARIPLRVAKRRRHYLMTLQKELSGELNRRYIGKTYPVLIDGLYNKNDRLYRGRTEFQAPEVDGFVIVKSNRTLKPGLFVKVKIYASSPYILFAVATG